MSGESAPCWKTVPIAEHEILKANYESLKAKHESLMREHESLINILEQMETEDETGNAKILETEKRLEALENVINGLMSLEETQNLSNNNNNNTVSDKDVIVISDDDDERECKRGDSNSPDDNNGLSFIL